MAPPHFVALGEFQKLQPLVLCQLKLRGGRSKARELTGKQNSSAHLRRLGAELTMKMAGSKGWTSPASRQPRSLCGVRGCVLLVTEPRPTPPTFSNTDLDNTRASHSSLFSASPAPLPRSRSPAFQTWAGQSPGFCSGSLPLAVPLRPACSPLPRATLPWAERPAPGQAGEALLKLDPLTGPRLLPALLLCPTGAEFTPNYLVLPT